MYAIRSYYVYSKKRRMPDYLKAVVVVPDRTISTAKSRTILPKVYKKEEAVYSLSSVITSYSIHYTKLYESIL